ncbi:MAG: hypothetical protein P8X74_21015 [Reinekea sp.]
MSTTTNSISNPNEVIQTSYLTEIVNISPCGKVSVRLNQAEVAVQLFVRGLPALKEGDSVLVDVLANGNVIVRSVVESFQHKRSVIEFTEEKGHAQIAMPEHVDSFSIALGNAQIELNRNGNLRLNGETIVSNASGLNQLLGKPVSLN